MTFPLRTTRLPLRLIPKQQARNFPAVDRQNRLKKHFIASVKSIKFQRKVLVAWKRLSIATPSQQSAQRHT